MFVFVSLLLTQSPPCALAKPVTEPPLMMSTADLLERLRVPEKVDDKSCAAWRALGPTIEARRERVFFKPLPAPLKRSNVVLLSCGVGARAPMVPERPTEAERVDRCWFVESFVNSAKACVAALEEPHDGDEQLQLRDMWEEIVKCWRTAEPLFCPKKK